MDGAALTWSGRVEDDPLLKGQGRFGDDVKPAGTLAAIFVRSPHAHARITAIDVAAAKKAPGVVAVLTGQDFAGLDLDTVTGSNPIPGWDGAPPKVPFRPVLATERVMHVGELVALVLADTELHAQDAAELVAVSYDTLPPAVDPEAAVAAGAPQLWPQAPANVALDWHGPRIDAVEAGFAKAAHVTRLKLTNQRIAAVSLEPRVATASYDPASDKYTLRTGTQGVWAIQMQTCAAMKLAPQKLRVLTDDVGGGFGMKASGYPEYVALLLAAKKIGKPLHWSSTRSEAFMSDTQARDMIFDAQIAFDDQGKVTALRIDVLADIGAYLTGVALYCCTVHMTGCLPTVYDIPTIDIRARGVFTNKVPIGPYRGAGRPEINFILERLMDKAAREMKRDPADLRRRNLITPAQLPYKTFVGATFDTGDFPTVLDKALAASDYAGFAARKADAATRGRLRGIGLGTFLEISGGLLEEGAAMKFAKPDRITVSIAPSAQGQGHKTVFGKVAADRLGLPFEAVEVEYGDSDRDVPGLGAVASRSAMLVGSAVAVTADLVIEKGKKAAAVLLQSDASAVTYERGVYVVPGSGRQVTLFEVAARAPELVAQGAIAESMDTRGHVTTAPSYPNGCHVAEVEVDPETGGVEIVRYTAVGDCGNILERTVLEGQVHGGVAQGLGQALLEHMLYDNDSGQILSGSFMDYGMPRAADVPPITVMHHSIPCQTNTVGAKGVGESGTTAAPCAIVNAVIDAIGKGDDAGLQMPLTPQKVWRALHA
jgi:carbon-monoxide dehydrogenase large subunit